MCGSVIVALGVLALIDVLFEYPKKYHFSDWPQEAQDLAISEMARAMIRHDCGPQMEVFGETEMGENYYLFWSENKICRGAYQFSGWEVDKVMVTAFFRCDLDDRWGDYAVTVFRNPNNSSGQKWCDYRYFPKSEDNGAMNNLILPPPNPPYSGDP